VRRTLCVLTVVLVAAAAAPAQAAEDAWNSQGLRKAVSVQGMLEHERAFQAIADLYGSTRESGTPGYEASRDYVVARLQAAGYDPVVQPFEFPFFQELATPEFARVSPDPETYTAGSDFSSMTYSGSGNVSAATTHVTDQGGAPGAGCEAADFAGFPAGNVALIQRGSCTFKIKATNAIAANASAVVIYNNVDGPLNGTLGSPGQSVPVIGTTQAIGQEQAALLAGGATVVLHVFTATQSEIRTTWNVLADTGGRADRTMVVGAHLDSRLEGPGINDNGSGSSAILEIAEQFAARGIEPRNRVRFAWWGAEEFNLLGSTFYVNNLSDEELADHEANLNYDMIASPNYVRFVYDGDNSAFPVGPGVADGPDGSGLIERIFVSYFNNQGLATDPTAFDGRSDYGPFIAAGIPAGGLFSGAEQQKTVRQETIYGGTAGAPYDACYHQLCDDIDNLNNTSFEELADGAAHAIYTLAKDPYEVKDANPVKQGKNGTPQGTNDVSGAGSGGGGHAHASRSLKAKRGKAAKQRRGQMFYRGSQAVR
jgi:Zn-dependent M28 family amino/carboxypeptidase